LDLKQRDNCGNKNGKHFFAGARERTLCCGLPKLLLAPGIIVMDRAHAKAPVVSIVDDDDSMRSAMCSFVRSLGLTVYGFASADEFLQSPCLSETSCLISDVQMPNMSGVELQNALIAQGHRIPIIFLTAFPDKTLEVRAMNAGAIAFLSKPFDEHEMITCIGKAIKAAGLGISEN
jgi:FixJ family two-component response regulator